MSYPSLRMTDYPMVRVNFDICNHISGTTEATVAKFCMQVEYIKCLSFDDRLLPNGRDRSHDFLFCLNFAPIISMESVKLHTSNFVCCLYVGVLVHA